MTGTAPERIPFYNKGGNVAPLLAEVQDLLASIAVTSEVVCIDDGSADSTGAELAVGARNWPGIWVEHFERNRGQAAALRRGFQTARGEWIAILDGDGQNPPAEIARLWSLRGSADMIIGVRTRLSGFGSAPRDVACGQLRAAHTPA